MADRTKEIVIYRQPKDPNGHTWRCAIHRGPGHHGTGASEAEALYHASLAWFQASAITEEGH